MDCVECGEREASVFIRRSGVSGAPGRAAGTDLALCEICARRRGVSAGRGQLSIRLEDLVAPTGDGAAAALLCPSCGAGLDLLRRRGRLGCPACAAAFRGELDALLRARGAARPPWYRGEGPPPSVAPAAVPAVAPSGAGGAPPEGPRPERASTLAGDIAAALAREDYELAARLRDRLNALSAGIPAPPGPNAEPASAPVFGFAPEAAAEGDDVILSSSARLVRNYADLPFPSSAKGGATPSRSRAEGARAALAGFSFHSLADLPPSQARSLAERSLAARAWTADPESRLGLAAEGRLALLLDESDHLVLLARLPGLAVRGVLGLVEGGAASLGPLGPFAFDEEFGWLSPRVDWLGAGLGLSLLLHLPALSFLGVTERVLGPLLEAGLVIHGFHGAEEGSAGDIFEVMTEHAYGASAERLAAAAEAAAGAAAAERRARGEIATWKTEELLDRAGRAIGLLRHARRLDEGEAASALSALRLAALTGNLAGLDAREAGRLLLMLGPASIAVEAARRGLETSAGQDAASRAARLRSRLLAKIVEDATIVEGGHSCSRA